ncbi:MAG: hypothetical protein Q7T76_18810 [Ferruginibacter sp.]|nr:hypothetical protein [Ferruginibacter sp.]
MLKKRVNPNTKKTTLSVTSITIAMMRVISPFSLRMGKRTSFSQGKRIIENALLTLYAIGLIEIAKWLMEVRIP